MTILSFSIVASLLIFHTSFGAEPTKAKSTRKPTQVERMVPVQLKVVYGEKTTFFTITKSTNGGRVEYSNNLGQQAAKEISMTDYEFLRTKITGLKGTSNEKRFCSRNFVEVFSEGRKLVGCLGAGNRLAKELQETANLLSILF